MLCGILLVLLQAYCANGCVHCQSYDVKIGYHNDYAPGGCDDVDADGFCKWSTGTRDGPPVMDWFGGCFNNAQLVYVSYCKDKDTFTQECKDEQTSKDCMPTGCKETMASCPKEIRDHWPQADRDGITTITLIPECPERLLFQLKSNELIVGAMVLTPREEGNLFDAAEVPEVCYPNKQSVGMAEEDMILVYILAGIVGCCACCGLSSLICYFFKCCCWRDIDPEQFKKAPHFKKAPSNLEEVNVVGQASTGGASTSSWEGSKWANNDDSQHFIQPEQPEATGEVFTDTAYGEQQQAMGKYLSDGGNHEIEPL